MRYLSKALVHGLGWLHQAKQNDPAHNRRVLTALSYVAKSIAHDRRLEDMFDYMDGYGGGGDPFGSLVNDELAEELGQCGIDLEEIMDDVLASVMMGGGITGNGDMMGGGNMMGGDPEGDDSMMAMMGGLNLGDIFSSLAEDGEIECDAQQEADYKKAMETFNACTGFDQLELGLSDDLVDSITEKCDEAMDAASGVAMGQSEVDMDAMSDCIDEILGQNVIGDLLRNIYHNPDKICQCTSDLGDAMPTCLIKISIPEDSIPDGMEDYLPEGMNDMMFPLSLFKKATCLVGIGCNAIDDMCKTELAALDSCLPSADKTSFSCLNVIEKCALEPDQPVSVTAPPLLTTSELPDACQRVYSQAPNNNIIERYSNFNAVCNNNASDDTNTEVATTTTEEEEDESPEESSEYEYRESSEDEYKESSEEESSTTLASAAQDETSESSGGSKTWAPLVAVAGVIGAIAAFVIIRRRRAAVGVTSFPGRSNFSAVLSVDEIDDSLTFEEGHMA